MILFQLLVMRHFFQLTLQQEIFARMHPCLFQINLIIYFQLRTTVTDGVNTIEHIETVNLALTESLQASSSIIAKEADVISVNNAEFSSVNAFASRDFNREISD